MWVMIWIGLSFVVGALAGNRDRSFLGWTLLSLVISPIIGGLFMLCLGLPYYCAACRTSVRKGAEICPMCRNDLTA